MPRFQLLRDMFGRHFQGAVPTAACRVPGRVNLIGEHLDYNGLPVLPMAIDRELTLLVSPRDDGRVRLVNTDAAYPDAEFANGKSLAPSAQGAWDNYVKASLEAINRRFGLAAKLGLDILVDSTLPPAAGLSSSSALVVGAALAYLAARGIGLDEEYSRIELATLLAEGEHYVGTQGGGMDHAAILLSTAGCASQINFFPLRTEPVPLFADHLFLVAHSLVRAEKSAQALERYNEGPQFCRLIVALIERYLQQTIDEDIELDRMAELWTGHLCLTDAEVKAVLDEAFSGETTSIEEAAATLGLTRRALCHTFFAGNEPVRAGLPLRRRARHVITEFGRVEAARDALLARDAEELGRLLNASHASSARDYEISCPELDALASAACDAGALGARLTGAGHGGCVVCLVPAEQEERFRSELERRYYRSFLGLDAGSIPAEAVLTARAAHGASYIDLDRR